MIKEKVKNVFSKTTKRILRINRREKREIKDLDISEDKKSELYLEVEETIQRRERNRISYLNTQIAVAHLNEDEKRLERGLRKMKTIIKETDSNLENLVKIIKANKDSSSTGKRTIH